MSSVRADLYLNYALDPGTRGYTSVMVSEGEGDERIVHYTLPQEFGLISRQEMMDVFVSHIRRLEPERVFIEIPGMEKPLPLSKKTVRGIIEGDDLRIGKE